MSVTGYSPKQIWLHWIIAVLIIVQFVLQEGMSDMWHQVSRGQTLTPTLIGQSHVVIGILIFVLGAYRLFVRLNRGAPAAPADEPAVLRFLAGATHLALYAVILVMPISGSVAWFGGVKAAAEAHEVGKAIMLLFVALHVAGAIYQHFILKTDVVRRMVRAER